MVIMPSLDIHMKSRTLALCRVNASLVGPSRIHRQLRVRQRVSRDVESSGKKRTSC